VSIEIARKADAIRIPVAALRFRPSADVLAALNQANPAEPARGGQQGAGPVSGGSGTAAASGTPLAAVADTNTPGLTAAALPRPATALPASRDGTSNSGQSQPQGPATSQTATGSLAPTVDALFGPLPVTETSGRVWLFIGDRLELVRVRLGISDGAYTELVAGDLQPGTALVSSVALPAQAAGARTAGRSPLITPSRGTAGGARPTGS